MNRLKNKKIEFYVVSLMLHLALWGTALLYLSFNRTEVLDYKIQTPWIHAYSAPSQEQAVRRDTVCHSSVQTVSHAPLALKRVFLPSQRANGLKTKPSRSSRSMAAAISSSNEGPIPEALLLLLHSAIQAHQHYPLVALEHEEQGTAQVQFTLLKDGSALNIRIARSSGKTSLDTAALIAVQEAQPFEKAAKYIESPRNFSIEVSFEISP